MTLPAGPPTCASCAVAVSSYQLLKRSSTSLSLNASVTVVVCPQAGLVELCWGCFCCCCVVGSCWLSTAADSQYIRSMVSRAHAELLDEYYEGVHPLMLTNNTSITSGIGTGGRASWREFQKSSSAAGGDSAPLLGTGLHIVSHIPTTVWLVVASGCGRGTEKLFTTIKVQTSASVLVKGVLCGVLLTNAHSVQRG